MTRVGFSWPMPKGSALENMKCCQWSLTYECLASVTRVNSWKQPLPTPSNPALLYVTETQFGVLVPWPIYTSERTAISSSLASLLKYYEGSIVY